MVTVEDVWREALPEDTRLLAGRGRLGRQVSWVLRVKPRPPGLEALRGDELILVSSSSLPSLDPHLTLTRAIQSVSEKASAVAVRGEPGDEAVDEAERLSIPLLQLPDSAALPAVERDVLHYLSEQRAEWYQRKHSVLQDLTALALQGEGLDAIAQHMGEDVELAVTFEDEGGRVLAWYLPGSLSEDQAATVRSYAGDEAAILPAPAWGKPVAMDGGLARLSAPVTAKDGWAGSVSLFGPEQALDTHAYVVLEAGATAGAIELAREHAVLETVHRIQGDLISDLVAGQGDREELERRARRMEHDLEASRAGLVFCPVPEGDHERAPSREVLTTLRNRLARALSTHGVQAPMYLDEGLLAVFYPVEGSLDAAGLRRLGERLRRDLADAARRHRLYVGVSRVHQGIDGFRAGLREARRAFELGHVLAPDRLVTYFGDLGVYRILFGIRDTGEMQEFYEDMLGRLIRYDQEKKTELVPTLDAFLCANNASEVAVRLNLHRNSLLYRLRRIREITGLDLDDAETRLTLHLALRVGEALRADVRREA